MSLKDMESNCCACGVNDTNVILNKGNIAKDVLIENLQSDLLRSRDLNVHYEKRIENQRASIKMLKGNEPQLLITQQKNEIAHLKNTLEESDKHLGDVNLKAIDMESKYDAVQKINVNLNNELEVYKARTFKLEDRTKEIIGDVHNAERLLENANSDLKLCRVMNDQLNKEIARVITPVEHLMHYIQATDLIVNLDIAELGVGGLDILIKNANKFDIDLSLAILDGSSQVRISKRDEYYQGGEVENFDGTEDEGQYESELQNFIDDIEKKTSDIYQNMTREQKALYDTFIQNQEHNILKYNLTSLSSEEKYEYIKMSPSEREIAINPPF